MCNNYKTETQLGYKEKTEIKKRALSKLEEQVRQQIEELTNVNRDDIISICQGQEVDADIQEVDADIIEENLYKIINIICNSLKIDTNTFTEDELHEVNKRIIELNKEDCFILFCMNRGVKPIRHILNALSKE